MIKPTIGRVVLVSRNSRNSISQWQPALICRVNADDTINVGGFDTSGTPFAEIDLELRQGDITDDPVFIPQDLIGQRFACWMPYQRQQSERKEKEG